MGRRGGRNRSKKLAWLDAEEEILCDPDAAKCPVIARETELQFLVGGEVRNPTSYYVPDAALKVFDLHATAGEEFKICVRNKNANVAINPVVDGQCAVMPQHARRPDGTVTKQKKPCLPVYKGAKWTTLPGFQSALERTEVEFTRHYQKFECIKADFTNNPADFPVLEMLKVEEAAARSGDDVEGVASGEPLVGGIMKIHIHELERYNVYGRSMRGGVFAETRDLRTADCGILGLKTRPGDHHSESKAIGNRQGNGKVSRGKMLCTFLVFYGDKALPKLEQKAILDEVIAEDKKRKVDSAKSKEAARKKLADRVASEKTEISNAPASADLME